MAGWSTLTNGSTLDSRENVCVHRKNGLVFGGESGDDHETDESDVGVKVRLRTLFDEVMSLFIKAIAEKGMFRPVPAMLPCEKSVDLFYLFWVVREKGGYESVSKKKLWGFVAKKLGLGLGAGAMAAVKLVYFKYLSELEQWLNNRGKCGPCGNFGLLSLELETEFRDSFSDCRLVQIEKRKKLCLSDSKCSGSVKCNGDNADIEFGDKNRDNDDDDDDDDDESDRLLVLNSSGDDKKEKDNKRKRESLSLSGLVKWLAEIAKHSGDPSIGAIGGPSSKLKEHEEKELWAQAIRARDVLLLRRHVVSNNQESLLQKKQKMHPSMYEDDIAPSHQSSERSRCSKRLTNLAKSRLCSCCNSCSPSPSKLIKSPRKVEVDNEPEEAAIDDDLPALANEACPLEDESVEKHFSVGPLFQADVPEWTGVVSESDPKWLGTQVWPLECREHKYPTAETDTIGKGRPEFCDCSLPGSVECVRFHIAEARMKLKLELGPAFYHWKFDHMGEEVSLRWTAEQEKRFKDIVTSNRYFGDRKIRWFPTKTMENMVSYYFNVFLVQKRSYQNRVTPKDIDSDDDEKEFGSVGGPFGNNVVDISGICVQNKQCTDFE